MAVVESFEPTYFFKQQRVSGDDLRLLRAYPGKWQVGWGRQTGFVGAGCQRGVGGTLGAVQVQMHVCVGTPHQVIGVVKL